MAESAVYLASTGYRMNSRDSSRRMWRRVSCPNIEPSSPDICQLGVPKRITIEPCDHTLQASQARVVLAALRPGCPSEIRRRLETGEMFDRGVGFAGAR